jgi:hypothetical protein
VSRNGLRPCSARRLIHRGCASRSAPRGRHQTAARLWDAIATDHPTTPFRGAVDVARDLLNAVMRDDAEQDGLPLMLRKSRVPAVRKTRRELDSYAQRLREAHVQTGAGYLAPAADRIAGQPRRYLAKRLRRSRVFASNRDRRIRESRHGYRRRCHPTRRRRRAAHGGTQRRGIPTRMRRAGTARTRAISPRARSASALPEGREQTFPHHDAHRARRSRAQHVGVVDKAQSAPERVGARLGSPV